MKLRILIRSIIGPIIIIALWQGLYLLNLLETSLLPSPFIVFKTFYSLLSTGIIIPDIVFTLSRMFSGYSLAAIIGIVVGLLIGLYRPLYDAIVGVIDFFRSIPVTTLYPVFVLSLGIGHTSKIAMVFWASFFIIVLNSAYGVLQSPKLRAQMASLYGANKIQIFKWIVFYDALPQTMIGLRVALSYALIVEILCEMFMGSEFGIGQKVTEAWTTYAIDKLYALIILAGFLGLIFNRIFVFIERRIVPWVLR